MFDQAAYNGRLVGTGTTSHILGIRKDICTKIGKQPGGTVHVTFAAAGHLSRRPR